VEVGGAPPTRSYEPGDLVGESFADRYHVQRLAADGANTAILDASDLQSGRDVTLKLVRPRLAASPSFRNRFDETMRSVAALSHPNIAAVYDWGITRVGETSTAYVIAEHLTGGSLRDMFDRGRRLTPSQALSVGLDVCRGLDHAHRRGFVHSELAPAKLVFGDDRRVRIVDFGLAGLLGEAAWKQPDSVSTHVAWYSSPEQAQSQPIDGKTDVYALCLVLQEAVTGALPFCDDSTVASLSARVGKLMPVSADLGALASIFEHAGRPEPDERSSAAEFGKELVQAASKLPRPEPLPLLSTGLFDTPAHQLRSPDDPTGGVRRPGDESVRSTPVEPLVIIAADTAMDGEPIETAADDAAAAAATAAATAVATDHAAIDGLVDLEDVPEIPIADPADDLVILPLDAGIVDGSPSSSPPPIGPVAEAAPTQVMPAAVVSPPAKRRRGFPWKTLLGVLIVAALVTLGILASRLFATPTYLVPDLIELPEAEARNLIAANGWEITVDRERSDLVPVAGQVVRTAPQAGVELAEGEPFLMVVSLGPTLRELPDSTGVPVGEAANRLEERGLVAETEEAHDEVVLEGVVISWSVPGDPTVGTGSLVEPETVVLLVVSLGPEPRVVPDVIGRTVGEVSVEFAEMGLSIAEGPQEFSDEVPIGVIISQSIDPGTEVERGTELTVVVSKGQDLVIYPDLTGVTIYEDAAQILLEEGFQPNLVFGDAQGQIISAHIDGEEPRVGETYRRGTRVDFRAL